MSCTHVCVYIHILHAYTHTHNGNNFGELHYIMAMQWIAAM